MLFHSQGTFISPGSLLTLHFSEVFSQFGVDNKAIHDAEARMAHERLITQVIPKLVSEFDSTPHLLFHNNDNRLMRMVHERGIPLRLLEQLRYVVDAANLCH
jgi:hypothetical protein